MKKGVKYDVGKRLWNLFLWREAGQIVDVLTYGAKKYPEPDNWKRVSNQRDRYFAALMRHLTAWWNGEKCDQESGLLHLAHAGCCLLFLMWRDNEEDIRSGSVQRK